MTTTDTDWPKLYEAIDTVLPSLTHYTIGRGLIMIGLELALAAPEFWQRVVGDSEFHQERKQETDQICAAIQEKYDGS